MAFKHVLKRMALKQILTLITSPGSMHETGCLGLVHWDDPEGWDVEGVGRGVQDGDTCIPMADSCQCMAKTTTVLSRN